MFIAPFQFKVSCALLHSRGSALLGCFIAKGSLSVFGAEFITPDIALEARSSAA